MFSVLKKASKRSWSSVVSVSLMISESKYQNIAVPMGGGKEWIAIDHIAGPLTVSSVLDGALFILAVDGSLRTNGKLGIFVIDGSLLLIRLIEFAFLGVELSNVRRNWGWRQPGRRELPGRR